MASDKQRLEDTAAYLVRNPLSLKKLVYLDGHKAVLYRSRMNPSLGRNFEAMDPLEWLARNQHSISRILEHLGLRAPEQDKPPPAREILRVAEAGEGWGVPASWD
jgi:hypothetical protein